MFKRAHPDVSRQESKVKAAAMSNRRNPPGMMKEDVYCLRIHYFNKTCA
jgi:hypothetical protein